VLKGTSHDFFPNRDTFLLLPAAGGQDKIEVTVSDLKAVFFVKTYAGNPQRDDKTDFSLSKRYGRKAKVLFEDGEEIYGYVQAYSPNQKGFFIFPADPESNNDRLFALNAAVLKVTFVDS
jgi:hypothetical protein